MRECYPLPALTGEAGTEAGISLFQGDMAEMQSVIPSQQRIAGNPTLPIPNILSHQKSRNDPLTKKREVFLMKLLPCHPPVLREWYLRQFSHPTSWYLARTSLVRTLSVMSIVGFMLGLGDRHGENILLDSTCGDIVHVDFNCLFNKGERFDWPERVPFRLTHNLVNAMGPTGVEGLYRHSCEITTRVMRQQIDQLMSVVRPFCYDPLVSWNTDKNARDENAEMTNEKALEDIQNIESRLQGIVRTRNRAQSIPLSVEGQVRTLIAEATNIDNLCQMYIGWGPYL
ncbi:hypothetical protein J6590_006816 [Homalodisca vitripennis]|nr:hypothetical protein J6590_006816 [Homalodisca vitripennis]